MRRSFAWSLVALVLALMPRVQAGPADQSAADLAKALQQMRPRQRLLGGLRHAYRGGVLNKTLTERGRLIVKKPGKMRCSTAPERKLFVSDGVKFYSCSARRQAVIMSAVPADDNAATPALFLAGKGSLTRDFVASLADVPADLPPGTRGLKLTPKAPQPDYDWLILAVEPTTMALKGLVTVDAQGGTSSFSFTNLKENVGLADNAFDFKVPRGVDLVTDPSLRR